jgi:hypothetical protein
VKLPRNQVQRTIQINSNLFSTALRRRLWPEEELVTSIDNFMAIFVGMCIGLAGLAYVFQ